MAKLMTMAGPVLAGYDARNREEARANDNTHAHGNERAGAEHALQARAAFILSLAQQAL